MHPEEKQLFTAVAITAVVLGAVIFVFIYTMIRHQRRFLVLHKAKMKAVIEALEQERKRIAADIHDELGPILSAIRIQINLLEYQTESDKKIVQFSSKHIDNILTKTREISFNLMPVTLDRNGLKKALEELISKFDKICETDIQLECEELPVLPEHTSLNAYRICQEIIHNTVKHAQASMLKLRITIANHKLMISSADNGIGYDYDDKINKRTGLGLFGLQSRADVLNAEFNWETKSGAGTKYLFKIPLNA